MTDWPKMESMVMVTDGYFVSEEFKSFPESVKKDAMEHLQGVPVKIVGLALYDDNSKHCDVLAGETAFRVSIEFIEPVVINKPEDNNEPTSEETKPAKAVAVEEKTEIVSFPFTDYSRMEGALLFFARNGYKVWVEDTCHGPMFLKEGKLNVEMPKEVSQ